MPEHNSEYYGIKCAEAVTHPEVVIENDSVNLREDPTDQHTGIILK